jgi:nucleoside phosphorylase
MDRSEPRIGIITALPVEFAAARQILSDPERIAVPGQGAGRQYEVGWIGSAGGDRHTVVLALAAMGNNIASSRATLLLEHFENVEVLIMVGIAGAVPHPKRSNDHVRLGDIVISDKKGVIQYDYVKLREIRACPIAPNAKLVETVTLLVAEEIQGARPWDAHIEEILAKLDWERPRTDRLFASRDPTSQIKHPEDTQRKSGVPRVFLGPIASANTLLKNPRKRDALRDKFGVKAVEMEGSGIADATWNHARGYLVIRGTCDYCDSRKNDKWHKYAAAAAAGYTKSVIEYMFTGSETALVKEDGKLAAKEPPIRPGDFPVLSVVRGEKFIILDTADASKLELPMPFPELHSYGKTAVLNAAHWKRVHTLAERCYRPCMDALLELQDYDRHKDPGHQASAGKQLNDARNSFHHFSRDISLLPEAVKLSQPVHLTERVGSSFDSLLKIVVVGWSHRSFPSSLVLMDWICRWLLSCLSRADDILEDYFAELKVNP